MNKLDAALGEFHPIHLVEMDRVRLMNRVDTKYAFHSGLLPEILSRASADYRVLTIEGVRMFRYRTLYFDTPGLGFYLDHHNGIRPRYKVRFREYLDTGQVFFEVKRKTNTERTRKSRMPANRIEFNLSQDFLKYASERIPGVLPVLGPTLEVFFRRITLVSGSENERITIDLYPAFILSGRRRELPGLVISEVKKEAAPGSSTFMKLLKQRHIYPVNLSKYCLGMALLMNGIKINRLKENINKINRLENEYAAYTAAG